MWSIYVWLWSNAPAAAFLVTAMPIIVTCALLMAVMEPRHTMGQFQDTRRADPPKPEPRRDTEQNRPRVWIDPVVPDTRHLHVVSDQQDDEPESNGYTRPKPVTPDKWKEADKGVWYG